MKHIRTLPTQIKINLPLILHNILNKRYHSTNIKTICWQEKCTLKLTHENICVASSFNKKK